MQISTFFQVLFTALGAFCILRAFKGTDSGGVRRRATATEEEEQDVRILNLGNRRMIHGDDQLRIAAFGSSNAWGAALTSRFQAYPFLISPEVDNYADFSAGPNYPAVCAETLIGEDDMYDVILLDYWLKADQGLLELATRLRARFPQALMIFYKLWTPNHARRKDPNNPNLEQSLEEWKRSINLVDGDYEAIKRALYADNAEWYFPIRTHADFLVKTSKDQVGGRIFEFPKRNTTKDTIIAYLGYFDSTYHSLLSELGHKVIADITKTMIRSNVPVPYQQVHSAVHGSWGDGDSCHLWFTTGATSTVYSSTFSMVEYDDLRGKFALQLSGPGWIDIYNPFKGDRTVYLSFLATKAGVYPVVDATTKTNKVVTKLKPVTTADIHNAHLTKTIPLVNKLPHGLSRITFQPTETTNLPFRLVGASFTNEQVLPLELGFGPTFNGH